MRTLIYIFFLTAFITFECPNTRGEPTNTALVFYVLKAEKIEGGRFINTTNFPNIGHIAAIPDFAVTKLKAVYRAAEEDEAIMIGVDGKPKVIPNQTPPSLSVQLAPKDSQLFAIFTGKVIGKRLLIMVGDTPLSAPKVTVPIDGGIFAVSFADDASLRKAEGNLKKLVQ